MDRDKLAKVLALTTSETDGEALAAIRMANKLIAAEGLSWAELLKVGSKVTITLQRQPMRDPAEDGQNWVPPHLRDTITIDLMFRAVYSQPRSDNEEFWQFMDSIHQRWKDHGNLSQGQYNGLKRSYQRVRRTTGP